MKRSGKMERLQPLVRNLYTTEKPTQPGLVDVTAEVSDSKERRATAKKPLLPRDSDKACRQALPVKTTLPALRAIHHNIFAKLSLFFWHDGPVDESKPTKDGRRPDDVIGSAAETNVLRDLFADLVQRKGYTMARLIAELAQFSRDKPRDCAQCHQYISALFSTIAAGYRKSVSGADMRTLLELVSKFDGSFSDLFSDAFASDGDVSQRTLATLDYALSHAARLKVSQRDPSGEIPFVDAPMACGESALVLASRRRLPRLVKLLLRHGADPQRPWLGFRNAIELLLFAPHAVHVTNDDLARIERCMRYFSRALTRIDVAQLSAKEKDGYVALHPQWRTLVPRCRFQDPGSLRHLSRCAVHDSLREAGGPLPSCVQQLPIPQMLKDYTDLRWD